MVLFGLVSTWNYSSQLPADDFYQFWAVGRTIVSRPTANIYGEQERQRIGGELFRFFSARGSSEAVMRSANYRQVLEVYSTPFLYSVFGLIAWGAYEATLLLYRIACLGIASLAVMELCALCSYSVTGTLLLLAFVVTWFGPLMADLEVGNVNAIQLGLLAAVLRTLNIPDRMTASFAAGVVLGFTVMFKPNLVFVPVLLAAIRIMERRVVELGVLCIGLAVAVIVGLVFSIAMFGSLQCWIDWLGALRSMPDQIITTQMGNYALARVLLDWTGLRLSVLLVVICTGATLVCIGLGVYRSSGCRNASRDDCQSRERAFLLDASAVAVGCLVYLLSAPLVWIHYYVLVLPTVAIALRPTLGQDCDPQTAFCSKVLAGAALVGFAIHPLATLMGISSPLFFTLMFSSSAVILYWLGLRELSHVCHGLDTPPLTPSSTSDRTSKLV